MCIQLPARPRILLIACMLFGVVLAISGLLLVAGTQPIAAQVMVPSVCADTPAIPGTGANESAALIADCNALWAARTLLTTATGLDWMTSTLISSWEGITVTGTMSRVTGVNLANQNLTGTIPAALGNLTALTRLDLSNNMLTDTIPASLANLSTTLRSLRLHSNQLRGQITTTLNVLTNTEFTISGNDDISGCIPPSLWSTITASDKTSIPQGWRGCCAGSQAVRSVDDTEPLVYASGREHSGLVNDCNVLLLSKNALRGDGTLNWDTSVDMANWTAMMSDITPELYLQGPQRFVLADAKRVVGLNFRTLLNGRLPPALKDLDALRVLEFGSFRPIVQLEGATIPHEWGSGFDELIYLGLHSQNLTGTIPASLGNLTTLKSLDLSSSYPLTGPIPPELGQLINLENLKLGNNQLRGTIPPELSQLINLKTFSLAPNRLTGKIPPELGNFTTSAHIDIQTTSTGNLNNFEGCHPFPDRTGDPRPRRLVSGLDECIPGSNPCYGSVAIPGWSTTTESPSLVADCNVLVEAKDSLQGTQGTLNWDTGSLITGWEGIGLNNNATQVITLEIPSRMLSGPIPTALGTLTNLRSLNLGDNQLTGTIPTALGSFTNLRSLNLGDNQLTGPILTALGSLPRTLQSLNLGGNQLTGSIPTALDSFTNLQSLSLYSNTLAGGIPIELGSLTDLRTLNLGGNQLTGTIPTALGSLTNLRSLNLGGNQLTGPILTALDSLPRTLRTLNLGGNQLTGSIPTALDSFTNLQSLSLYSNTLTGEIPAVLGDLSVLTRLDLSNNNLTGTIPASLANLSTTLRYLRLHNNQLRGQITTTLNVLTNLEEFTISGNDDISGCIPPSLWKEIPDLNKGIPAPRTRILPSGWRGCCADSNAVQDVDQNGRGDPSLVNNCNVLLDAKDTLIGDIGDGETSLLNWDTTMSMEDWTGLRDHYEYQTVFIPWRNRWYYYLQLSNRGLSGSIPPALGDLTGLEHLYLDGNRLTGPIPPELGKLTGLSHLYLHDNELTGTIPIELRAINEMGDLFLRGNHLSGCLPSNWYRRIPNTDISRSGLSECCNYTAAIPNPETDHEHLIAECNALIAAKDTLGASLDWDTSRSMLDRWQGIILGTTPYTSVQTLSFNNVLSGSIPLQLRQLRGNLPQLRTLSLYSNTLTGGIPPWLGEFTNLRELSLYNNALTGTIPAALGSLRNLQSLSLYSNTLTGKIPTELGDLSNLRTLSLYSNTLTGTIPAALGNLRNLQTLDLRSNQLTGTIPTELGNLRNLRELYLTDNQFLSDACIPHALRNHLTTTDGPSYCPAPPAPPPSPGSGGGGGGGGGSTPRPTCTNGTVVLNPTDNAALVQDCVLLLTNKATLEGSISTSMQLNWSETRSIETWEGVTVGTAGDVQRVLGLRLDIEGKNLQGSLPATVNQLSGLRVLDISGNAISGRLPVGLSQLTGLEELDVSDNRLSGSIPTDLGRLANLSRLFLSGNSFSGCIPNVLLGVSEQDLADVGLPFCDPVTPTPTPALTPTPTVTPIPPAGRQLFLPLVNK